jgi:hypothetical protein
MSVLAYWNSRLVELKMIKAISQSHSTESSYAFFIKPNLRFVNVTCKREGCLVFCARCQHSFYLLDDTSCPRIFSALRFVALNKRACSFSPGHGTQLIMNKNVWRADKFFAVENGLAFPGREGHEAYKVLGCLPVDSARRRSWKSESSCGPFFF